MTLRLPQASRPHVVLLPACAAIFFGLMAFQGLTAKFDSGPNESDHLAAAQIYTTHWLPLPADHPDQWPSYSRYGVSYANSLNLSYPLAGWLMRAGRILRIPDFITLRSFNLVLLAISLIALVSDRRLFPMLPFMLLSPDIWYHFTYFNGDMLGFTAGVVAISAWGHLSQKNTSPEDSQKWLIPALTAGVTTGILLVSKINFTLLVAFFAWWVLWTAARLTPEFRRRWLQRAAVAGILAMLIGGARLSWDLKVNGTTKAMIERQMLERLAAPAYHPDNDKHPGAWPGLAPSRRGIGLSEVLIDNQWFQRTLRKGAGQFGYHHWRSIAGINTVLAVALGIGIVGMLLLIAYHGSKGLAGPLATAGTLFLVLNIIASIHHNMQVDFQPEFRYLLPAMLIIGACAVFSELHIHPVALRFFLYTGLLSLGTFVAAAVCGIPRQSGWDMPYDAHYFTAPHHELLEDEQTFRARRGMLK